MKTTHTSVATWFLVTMQVASTLPLIDAALAARATCNQPCVQQSDCTGTCSFCSTPTEYRWQCLES
ncbi:hypothetical protein F4819DRAFT_99381 [Hypoxylon fuscum]|nr:hypothetical protein F4819DRAFT_99381 [Hypoxylon fuscum]